MKNHPSLATNHRDQTRWAAPLRKNDRDLLRSKLTQRFSDLSEITGERLLDRAAHHISQISDEEINEWYGLLTGLEDASTKVRAAAQKATDHCRAGNKPVPGHVISMLSLAPHLFDSSYLDRLRAGDLQTQDHFVDYFSKLMRIKLRFKKLPASVVAEIIQETFLRVLICVRQGQIQKPEGLAAFVVGVCNNITFEAHRQKVRREHFSNLDGTDVYDPTIDPEGRVMMSEEIATVQKVFRHLSERDRRVLSILVLENDDKEDLCKQFGVSREYLRVLFHRAKNIFRDQFKYMHNRLTRQLADFTK